MDFLYLLKEEWSYHLINVSILIAFSIYGAILTINKNTKLEILRYLEKNGKDISKEKKEEIASIQKKNLLKEFFKAFGVLFALYSLYILFKMGYLTPNT